MRFLSGSTIWFSQVAIILLNLGVQIFLARLFSQEIVGVYFGIISLLNITTTIGSFGFNKYLLIIYSKYENITQRAKYTLVKLYMLLNTLGITFYLVVSFIFYTDTFYISILLLPLFLSNNLILIYITLLQVKNRFIRISANKMFIPASKVFSILVIGWYCQDNLPMLALAIGVLNLIFIIYLALEIYNLRNTLFNLNVQVHNESLQLENIAKAFIIILPYALTSLTFVVQTQGSTFLISIFDSKEKVALFANAFLILNAFYIFPTVLYQNIFAHKILKLMYVTDNPFIKKIYRILKSFIMYISILIVLFFSLISQELITGLFGDEYVQSAEIFQLLLLAVPFRLISISNGTFMSSDFLIKSRIRAEGIITASGLVIGMLAIPSIGLDGAILSVLIMECGLAVMFTYKVDQFFNNSSRDNLVYTWILLPWGIILLEAPIYIYIVSMLIIIVLLVLKVNKEKILIKEVIK